MNDINISFSKPDENPEVSVISVKGYVDTTTSTDLEESLGTLGGMVDGGESGGFFKAFGAGLSLVGGIVDLLQQRNQALLKEDMGLGEYLFIYSTAYYAWLGMSPGDGPPFQLSGDGHGPPHGSRHGPGTDPASVREEREERIRERINETLLPQLRCQRLCL